jgi:dihydrofolate reductase
MTTRKLILYIASSLDGYIAKPNDDLSFLEIVHRKGEDYGYHEFLTKVDTVILGRKTYDWVINQVKSFPHADKSTYIITRTARPENGNIKFYSENLKDLIVKLKSETGKDIFCDGGAELANELLKEQLIDDIIISIIPVLVGNGTKLFIEGRPEQALELISAKHFESGLVQLHYKATQ